MKECSPIIQTQRAQTQKGQWKSAKRVLPNPKVCASHSIRDCVGRHWGFPLVWVCVCVRVCCRWKDGARIAFILQLTVTTASFFSSLQTYSYFVTCQGFQSKGDKLKDSAIGTHQSNDANKMERKREKTEGDRYKMITKRGLIDQLTEWDLHLNRSRWLTSFFSTNITLHISLRLHRPETLISQYLIDKQLNSLCWFSIYPPKCWTNAQLFLVIVLPCTVNWETGVWGFTEEK